ncbi:lytic transglycosylase domain-containing protein [Parafrankia sp. EUN1f]|uniref:lytic transglycosylase domain-containing protein n=1 Tax=Parafrankia sp. EUN1f TaxID=102897 RepID=UPI0001C46FDE|nr:lytic transglycosylase domain-containing protein [Parafrankia sp. EUN1f]EFC86299.1 Membrane-bound lytic murein transglycosylase B-like protein [Parafrankia sp. EUN1f]
MSRRRRRHQSPTDPRPSAAAANTPQPGPPAAGGVPTRVDLTKRVPTAPTIELPTVGGIAKAGSATKAGSTTKAAKAGKAAKASKAAKAGGATRAGKAGPAARGPGQRVRASGLVRTTVLPTAVAASLLFFCTAATPETSGDTGDQLDTTKNPPARAGDWKLPDLVPNTPPETDPADLTTDELAQDATSDSDSPTTSITLTDSAKKIPAQLLAAYQKAADQLAEDKPSCHLPWELLAAIGRVESHHAQGRSITADGTVTSPLILGPRLDGTGGNALIRDSDNGALDHDTVYDRAVGPMQFIPTTWAGSGRDGNGDGVKNPHNIHDADLAAGHYLCARDRDLDDAADLRAAILSYNPSDAYVRTVLTWYNGYRQGGATPGTGSTTTDSSSPSLADVPITDLTPTGGTDGTTDPSLSPTTPGATLPPTPAPAITLDPGSCDPLRAADLAVALTDLDPDTAGAEALDLTTARLPWLNTTVTVEATATTTGDKEITTSWTTLQTGDGTMVPALLARLPGSSLAAAALTDDTVIVTLTVTPADQVCPAQMRLRIRNVPSSAFAADPTVPAPTATPTEDTPTVTPSPTATPATTAPTSPSATAAPTTTPTTAAPAATAAPTATATPAPTTPATTKPAATTPAATTPPASATATASATANTTKATTTTTTAPSTASPAASSTASPTTGTSG